MVVGPNGTGKSTILNALCLGLGGEPRHLGRADDARDFIMHGKEKAEIEIELQGEDDQNCPVFRRIIDRNRGSEKGKGRGASTFYIGDEKVDIQSVRSLVSDQFNISIDNLCTFLPQDKVGSFSGFTPQQLLQETEKTLSNSQHLYKTHLELIQAEDDLGQGKNEVATLEAKLKQLKHENEQLERAKEILEERERAMENAQLYRKKLVWLEFDEYRLDALRKKEEKNELKKRVAEARQAKAPYEEKVQEMTSEKKQMDAKFAQCELAIDEHKKELVKQTKKYENHDDKIEQIIANITDLENKRATLQANLERKKADVDKYQTQFDCVQFTEEAIDKSLNDARIKDAETTNTYQKAKRDFSGLERNHKELEEEARLLQEKLAKMNDDGAARKQRIFRQQKQLHQICQWLDQNRGLFRRRIWGPIVCEVTTRSQNAAAYLEQHVPNAILKAFVVETKSDQDLLYKKIKEEMNIPINILLVENGRLDEVVRIYSEEKMNILKRDHGVHGYLDDSFVAPDPVMQALRTQAAVHKVLVGGEATHRSIDEKGLLTFLAEPDRALGQDKLQGAVVFATKGNESFKFTMNISRYAKKPSTRVDQIGQAKMLAAGINPRAKKDTEEELKAKHDQMNLLRPNLTSAESKLNDAEVAKQEAHASAKSWAQRKENFAELKKRLSNAKQRLKEAMKELEFDDKEEKKKLLKSLMNCVVHSISALEQHAVSQKKLIDATISSAGVSITRNSLVVAERKARWELKCLSYFCKLYALTIIRYRAELEEKQLECQEIENRAARVYEEFNKLKKVAAEKKAEAEKIAPLVDEDMNPTSLREQLDSIEFSTASDCQAAMEEVEARANEIDANPDAIRQYESRLVEIESLQANLDRFTSEKDRKNSAILNKCRNWEHSLENYVSQVDKLFSQYMAETGCGGEIRLSKGLVSEPEQSAGNFKDWGIEIKVRFRENAKAQVLSQHVHSGGERALSTIMYLMALQNLMVAPFRCVDEINQGLDEQNERSVFKRIAQNSCAPPEKSTTDHSGQYFLITPKLLPNLYDMEADAMTVLFVFNGPYNFKSPTEWNLDHILAAAKSGTKRPIKNEAAEDDENSGNTGSRTIIAKKRRS